MSTNDDSASRRGRRADQGEHRGSGRPDRDDRWEQSSSRDRAPADPYQDQRARDIQAQRGGYSNFSRQAYPTQPEPTLPQPQGRYQEPVQRSDPARYVEPAQQAYTPPPPPYEPEPPHLTFDSGRDDLFGRDQGTPAFGHNPYAAQGASYQNDPYGQNRGQQPLTPASPRREEPQYIQREAPASPRDDYERNFPGRNTQETQASRFFLPDEEPPQKQRPAQPDRGYTPPPPPPQQQQYPAEAYPPQDQYDTPYEENWADENAFHEDDEGQRELVAQENELDEDFFADEDELENDHLPAPKRSRKKLMIAAVLTGAIVVGGGGAYLYKTVRGGGGEETATPYIRADNRPLKELPGNPGGKQFPNGEKTIYDRLTPDGQQI